MKSPGSSTYSLFSLPTYQRALPETQYQNISPTVWMWVLLLLFGGNVVRLTHPFLEPAVSSVIPKCISKPGSYLRSRGLSLQLTLVAMFILPFLYLQSYRAVVSVCHSGEPNYKENLAPCQD